MTGAGAGETADGAHRCTHVVASSVWLLTAASPYWPPALAARRHARLARGLRVCYSGGSGAIMQPETVPFAVSPFVPAAIGFFGLGAGYLAWGGQALFDFPKSTPDVNRTMAMWGFWMPGFLQFLTGVYLIIGLTWFDVFGNTPPLYMSGLAFTAYGVHWFAMAHRRYVGSSSAPDAWIVIAFLVLSAVGVDVCFRAGDMRVMLLFVGLTLIYLIEIPTRFLSWRLGGRLVGLVQLVTGVWLMYLTYWTAINIALRATRPV